MCGYSQQQPGVVLLSFVFVLLCVCVFVFVFVFEGFTNCVCGYGQQQPGDVLLSFVFNASTAASSQPLQTYRNISTRVEIQNVKKKSRSRHIVDKSKK